MSIKKVTRDYGLRQHEVEVINPETAEEQCRLIQSLMGLKSPDEVRKMNAEHVRAVLQEVGAGAYDLDLKTRFGEEAAYITMAEWLRNYDWLEKTRAKMEAGDARPENIALLILYAEELGRLQERIWWRHGVDSSTGTKREKLAMSARKSRQALPKARGARDANNAAVKAQAAAHRRALQDKAEIIWQRHPDLNNSAVARKIIKDWPKRDAAGAPKFDTLRNQIKKPDKA